MGMVGLGKKSQSASQLNPEGQSQLNQWLLKPTRTNDGLDPKLSFFSSALTDRPMATGDQFDHNDHQYRTKVVTLLGLLLMLAPRLTKLAVIIQQEPQQVK